MHSLSFFGGQSRSSGLTPNIGTVGFSYRDWMGSFYPKGASTRKQLQIYSKQFGVCELTQFMHQIPDLERTQAFVDGLGNCRLRFFVRIHNILTHGTDVGLSLTVAKHFRRALEPFFERGLLAGFVASFPYAFKNLQSSRLYLEQLSLVMKCPDLPFFTDFRHPSWFGPKAYQWMTDHNLSFVCVDEPKLPGLVPPLVVATAPSVLVRLHGRNREGWWSGNLVTRYDYSYLQEELVELFLRYEPFLVQNREVNFIFQNHWQAQSVRNAMEWRRLLSEYEMADGTPEERLRAARSHLELDEDLVRAPLALDQQGVKSRVSLALSDLQMAIPLQPVLEPDQIQIDSELVEK